MAPQTDLDQALADYGTCLLDIDGIGRVAAATIIAIVGDVRRFPTEGHFASFTGTAPVAASSGEKVRYRLNLVDLLFDIRNRRNVAHPGVDVDVTELDSCLVMRLSSSAVSEVVRIGSGLPARRVQSKPGATWVEAHVVLD